MCHLLPKLQRLLLPGLQLRGGRDLLFLLLFWVLPLQCQLRRLQMHHLRGGLLPFRLLLPPLQLLFPWIRWNQLFLQWPVLVHRRLYRHDLRPVPVRLFRQQLYHLRLRGGLDLQCLQRHRLLLLQPELQ